jgi:hypothetical protein
VKQLPEIGLPDPLLEKVRRDMFEAIRELQRMQPVVVKNVSLPDGEEIHVPHNLGRIPEFVGESCIRGALNAGRVETSTNNVDRTKYVKVTATGYGATITVDLVLL